MISILALVLVVFFCLFRIQSLEKQMIELKTFKKESTEWWFPKIDQNLEDIEKFRKEGR